MSRWRGPGPGLVVAAAFIGPGTVTTATLAGARFGVALLWTLAFAALATIVLQEMSARLGLATGAGLGAALQSVGGPPWWGPSLAGLGIGAVVMGAVAFQAGNLTGAALGLSAVTGWDHRLWVGITALVAGALLTAGRYRTLERVLAVLVAIMGVVFVTTAVLVAPALPTLLRGLTWPRLPEGSAVTALGLVGTTIVPYNLFLHATAVRQRWPDIGGLPAARRDLTLAIALGGVVSAAVVVTASAALGGTGIATASDMAAQLDPLLGRWAGRAFALGLAAAGLSSAITAPLAASYATLDVTRTRGELATPLARLVWGGTLVIGASVALVGFRPVPLILVAQVVNGLILPVVAAVLLVAMNDRRRLGDHVNGWRANLAGGTVVGLCLVLGIRTILRAF